MNYEKNAILVIEDDKFIGKAYSDGLKKSGFSVLMAASGEEGLKLAFEKNPGLIILDLMLPGMPGEQVLKNLKGDAKTKDIPVIVLSNKADLANQNNCIEMLGAADYFVKLDVSLKTLINTINKQLNK
jgi:DNA-binding response OmpR family regulator